MDFSLSVFFVCFVFFKSIQVFFIQYLDPAHLHTRAGKSLYIYQIARWFCFSFLTAGFYHFCGSDVCAKTSVKFLSSFSFKLLFKNVSQTRCHFLFLSCGNHKNLAVEITNEFTI